MHVLNMWYFIDTAYNYRLFYTPLQFVDRSGSGFPVSDGVQA